MQFVRGFRHPPCPSYGLLASAKKAGRPQRCKAARTRHRRARRLTVSAISHRSVAVWFRCTRRGATQATRLLIRVVRRMVDLTCRSWSMPHTLPSCLAVVDRDGLVSRSARRCYLDSRPMAADVMSRTTFHPSPASQGLPHAAASSRSWTRRESAFRPRLITVTAGRPSTEIAL